MKKVYINNNEILLPDNTDMKGSSGRVYHVIKDNEDLAVKIFLDKSEVKCYLSDKWEWYPKKDELIYFTSCYRNDMPILLSKYMVTDEDGKYIGCATDFITESKGESYEAIKNIPINLLFTYLYDIEKSISYFNDNGISLCDWQLDNVILGTIKDNALEKIFIFDDSNYSIDTTIYNSDEFNNLIVDITHKYLSDFNHDIGNFLSQKMLNHTHPISILEKITNGYSNLNECFADYAKIYAKK